MYIQTYLFTTDDLTAIAQVDLFAEVLPRRRWRRCSNCRKRRAAPLQEFCRPCLVWSLEEMSRAGRLVESP